MTTESDAVLMATGRLPNTPGLGLADVGVALSAEHGAVIVDDGYRTSVPSIYAVGDVIHRVALTPVALAEAMVFAHNRYGAGHVIDYHDVPTAVFTSPQVGVVGLTEAEARAQFARVHVYGSSFRPLKHTITGRPVRSFVKLIVEAVTDRVVGLHVVDEAAAEITQGFAAAMRCGITKRQLDMTIGIHPTVAEELVTMRTARPEPNGGAMQPALPTDAAELVDNFSVFDDWEERYSLPDRPRQANGPAVRGREDRGEQGPGCTSQVWFVRRDTADGRLMWEGDSDASIVQRSGRDPPGAVRRADKEEALAVDVDAVFQELGLERHLSMNRRNGFFSMVGSCGTSPHPDTSATGLTG